MARASTFRGSVTIEGSEAVRALAEELGRRAVETTALMELMAEPLAAAVRDYADMKPWAPLADTTVARKADQGLSTDILRDEPRYIKWSPTRVPDDLWSTLQKGGDRVHVTRTTVTLSISRTGRRFYAYFLQNTKKGPKRILMAIPEKNAGEIIALTGAWLTAPLRAAGATFRE